MQAHKKIIKILYVIFSKKFEAYSDAKSEVNEYLSTTLTAPTVIRGLIKFSPYTVVDIVTCDLWASPSSLRLYIYESILNERSSLSKELEKQSLLMAYDFPAGSILLPLLLESPQFAQQMEVYRPVGEAVLDNLRSKDLPEEDDLNFPQQRRGHYEKYIPNDIISNGTTFFEVMLKRSLKADINWHMWVLYFEEWAQVCEENYDPLIFESNHYFKSYDLTPHSGYHLRIESLVSVLISLIGELKNTPKENKNIILESLSPSELENDNIIKTAIITLGRVIHTVVDSEKFQPTFQATLVNRAWRCHNELYCDQKNGSRRYAHALRNALLDGGKYHPKEGALRVYRSRLWQLTDIVELNIKAYTKELSDAVDSIQKKFEEKNVNTKTKPEHRGVY